MKVVLGVELPILLKTIMKSEVFAFNCMQKNKGDKFQ